MSTVAERGPRPPANGLALHPFRALRYDATTVGDLGAVVAPPYDVIDDEALAGLESRHQHNVVRLIRPHAEPGGDAYAQAARTLRAWIGAGVLVEERAPALYVYEQRTPTAVQRGLVGAVSLRHPREGVILPHEDVMPGPVTDRLELTRATAANLEPILLAVDGGAATDAIMARAVRTDPLIDIRVDQGRHRVWRVDSPDDCARIAAELAGRSALIADGHHRYATYRRWQAERRAGGAGDGPWDQGLALVVDTSRYPLQVGAIHRAVAGLDVAAAADLAGHGMRVTRLPCDLPDGLTRLRAASRTGSALLAVDDHDLVLLTDVDPAVLDACMPPESSPTWRRIDAAVAHHVLIDGLWALGDEPRRVSYHHDLDSTLRAARRGRGLALLLNPVPVQEVHQLAARGERMPRKSTSFHPKPLTGLLMRLLHER